MRNHNTYEAVTVKDNIRFSIPYDYKTLKLEVLLILNAVTVVHRGQDATEIL